MELGDAIIHAEEVADRCAVTDGNIKCEMEHRQLAEWLRELKERREKDLQQSCNQLATDTTSRQASCEYCHEDSDGYVTPLEKNCHAYVRYSPIDGWVLSMKYGAWRKDIPIRFCPMCGRKLKNDK